MAIVSGICWSFKKECLLGIHDFSADTIKVALFTSVASLGPTTTAYSTTNEATGLNWPAGGTEISARDGYPAITREGYAVVAFENAIVQDVTVTFRAVLIYNSSKANRAIAVLDRGVDVILTDGAMVLTNNPAAPNLITFA